MAKNLPANAGDANDEGLIPELGRYPGERKGKPLQDFLPGKFHGQRSLEGNSPWGHRESAMTELIHTHTHTKRYK